ncbi:MAG TPA: phage holin family protein [Oscillatoriaceae cyanobacterium]
MLYMLSSWLISAVGFMLAAYLLPGFHVANFWAALGAAAVLGVCNAIIRPIVILFTLPLTLLTLGLFLLVINGLVLALAVWLVPGVAVANLGVAIVAAIVIAIVNAVLGAVLG